MRVSLVLTAQYVFANWRISGQPQRSICREHMWTDARALTNALRARQHGARENKYRQTRADDDDDDAKGASACLMDSTHTQPPSVPAEHNNRHAATNTQPSSVFVLAICACCTLRTPLVNCESPDCACGGKCGTQCAQYCAQLSRNNQITRCQ